MVLIRVSPDGWVDSHCGGAPWAARFIFSHSVTPARGSYPARAESSMPMRSACSSSRSGSKNRLPDGGSFGPGEKALCRTGLGFRAAGRPRLRPACCSSAAGAWFARGRRRAPCPEPRSACPHRPCGRCGRGRADPRWPATRADRRHESAGEARPSCRSCRCPALWRSLKP